MKKLLFLIALFACLLGMSVTGFAKTDEDDAAKEAYETEIADNWKATLKNSIALDKINAENKTNLLTWQDVENPPEEAKKLVAELLELQKKQEKEQESMDPSLEKGQ